MQSGNHLILAERNSWDFDVALSPRSDRRLRLNRVITRSKYGTGSLNTVLWQSPSFKKVLGVQDSQESTVEQGHNPVQVWYRVLEYSMTKRIKDVSFWNKVLGVKDSQGGGLCVSIKVFPCVITVVDVPESVLLPLRPVNWRCLNNHR